MAERYRRPRQKQNDRVSRQMKNRIALFWGLLLVVGVSMLVGRLAYLQLVDHEAVSYTHLTLPTTMLV